MKNTDTREKILGLLFRYPLRVFHLREMSRLILVSSPSVARYIGDLEREGLIVMGRKKFLHEISANLDNDRFRELKRVNNIKSVYDSGLLAYLKEIFPLSTIVLFGSYSKGDDTERSDIDIAIFTNGKKLDLDKYEKKLDRPINVEFIDFEKISKELKNSLINGLVLEGYIEV